jgi:SAM-dependent methyltransferase
VTPNPSAYWEDRHAHTEGLDGVGYLGLNALNTWMYRVRAHVFRRLLEPYASRIRGARVLDVGSGTGFLLEQWSKLGAGACVALDVADVACTRLRTSHPGVDVRRLDIGEASEEELGSLGQFDFISAGDVLFHITDDAAYARALANIARCLAPAGRFVFTENFLEHRPRAVSGWQVSRTRLEIERALSAAHLAIEKRVPLFALMNYPVDHEGVLLRGWWSLVSRVARRSRVLSNVIGASLYPIELALLSVLKDSPTTEIAIAVRLS